VKAFLPGMVSKCKGHIVTVASMAGLFGNSKLVKTKQYDFSVQVHADLLYMNIPG